MSPKQRRRGNRALRAAARGLSDAPDAEVMIETVRRWAAIHAWWRIVQLFPSR